MAKWDKFRDKLNSGQSDNTIAFDDLVTYITRLGWTPCGGDGGSHRKFSHAECVGLINIQKRADGMAKSYQNEYTELDGYVVRSFYSSDDEAFVAMIEALPGCYVDAPTRAEALENLRAEKAEWIRLMTERGHAIPAPEHKPGSVLA